MRIKNCDFFIMAWCEECKKKKKRRLKRWKKTPSRQPFSEGLRHHTKRNGAATSRGAIIFSPRSHHPKFSIEFTLAILIQYFLHILIQHNVPRYKYQRRQLPWLCCARQQRSFGSLALQSSQWYAIMVFVYFTII